jgi:hypothetical protein
MPNKYIGIKIVAALLNSHMGRALWKYIKYSVMEINEMKCAKDECWQHRG